MLDRIAYSYRMSHMKITIEMNCDNAAFAEDLGSEVAQVLKQVNRICSEAGYIETFAYSKHNLRDTNGNIVGTLVVDTHD